MTYGESETIKLNVLLSDNNRLRKFNNSLSMNFDFQIKIKFHTKSTLETLEIERSKKVLDSSQKIKKKHKLH